MPLGRFWGILECVGRVREVPQDFSGTPEAVQQPPSIAPGVPKSALGTPKNAAEAPRGALDGPLFVAVGLLNSSPALLQKPTFSSINQSILEGSGTPDSSLGALGNVAVVGFGASLRRFGVLGSPACGLEALLGH